MIHYSERMLQGCCSSVQYLDNQADDSVVPSLCIWHNKASFNLGGEKAALQIARHV